MQVLNFLQRCSAICHSNPSRNNGVLSTTNATKVLAKYSSYTTNAAKVLAKYSSYTTNAAKVFAKYSSYKSEQIRFGITLLPVATFPFSSHPDGRHL
jgi:hypothetical protein